MSKFQKLKVNEYCFEYKHINLIKFCLGVEEYNATIIYKNIHKENKKFLNFTILAFDDDEEYELEFSLNLTIDELNLFELNKIIDISEFYQYGINNFKLPGEDNYDEIGGFFVDNIYSYNNQFLVKKIEKNKFVFKLQFPEYPMLLWFIYKV